MKNLTMMNFVKLRELFFLKTAVYFLVACSEAPQSSQQSYVAPEVKTEVSPKHTYDAGKDLELMITGGTDATPAESINSLLEQGMNMYSIGQQRAFSQLLETEDQAPQDAPVENSPNVPPSLQQMADQLLNQYKQQIGVDPDTRVSEPKI